MKDIDAISISLENISFVDFNQYVEELLKAFLIPNSTIKRLFSLAEEKSFRDPIYVYKRAVFVNNSNSLNKSSFDLIEKDLSSVYRLLILVNNYAIICKDCITDEIIEFKPDEIQHHLKFFLPLIFGKADEKDLTTTLDFAELIGQLYNSLLLDKENDFSENESQGIDYILSLIYASFSKSVSQDKEIEKFFNWTTTAKDKNYNSLINGLFEAIFYNKRNGKLYSNLPSWNLCHNTKNQLPNINADSFKFSYKILCYDLGNLDPEILGSLVYKLTQEDESIYGHFTSFNNVSKVLNPLFIYKYENLIEKNSQNKVQLVKLRNEILSLTFFDPTNGPGCFLASAFNGVANLLEAIDQASENKLGKKINLAQFVGLSDNGLSFKLSHLTLWVSYIQYLIKSNSFLETALEDVYKKINILKGDQLETEWLDICPNEGKTFIIGSPIFKGAKKISSEEKRRMQNVFGTLKLGDIDYSSCWLYKSAKYINNTTSQAALVITNSLCQGAQVPFIWNRIYAENCEISFAYRSFKWKNSSKNSTGVSVIIIGLASKTSQSDIKYLFADNKIIKTNCIGPYLVNSTKTIVEESTKLLSKDLPKMQKGNMPYDKQNLLLTKEEKNKLVTSNGTASRFLKKIVGSKEFIHNIERWCLWIPTEDFQEANKISEISKRIEKVKQYRLSKTDKSAVRLASRPHQFREFRMTTSQSLVVPSVSSENRPYIPIGFIGEDTIVSNLAFAIYNCEPWIFGVISSRMHMVWIRTVCGSLETRLRYSSELGYNTFPFPKISPEKKNQISSFVFDIISNREIYCEKCLGDIYNDLPETLKILHDYLDKAIDNCYRDEPFVSDTERIKHLFDLYELKAN